MKPISFLFSNYYLKKQRSQQTDILGLWTANLIGPNARRERDARDRNCTIVWRHSALAFIYLDRLLWTINSCTGGMNLYFPNQKKAKKRRREARRRRRSKIKCKKKIGKIKVSSNFLECLPCLWAFSIPSCPLLLLRLLSCSVWHAQQPSIIIIIASGSVETRVTLYPFIKRFRSSPAEAAAAGSTVEAAAPPTPGVINLSDKFHTTPSSPLLTGLAQCSVFGNTLVQQGRKERKCPSSNNPGNFFFLSCVASSYFIPYCLAPLLYSLFLLRPHIYI